MGKTLEDVLYVNITGIGKVNTVNGKFSPGHRAKSNVEDDAGDAGKSVKRRGAKLTCDVLLWEDGVDDEALIDFEGTITVYTESGRTWVMTEAYCSSDEPEIAGGKLSLEYKSHLKAERRGRG